MDLLEREVALGDLDAALRDVVRGTGRLALVTGEAGIGKTSLVDCFARAQPPTVRVLWSSCDALFAPRPAGPLQEIAAQVDGALHDALARPGERNVLFDAMLAELQRRPSIVVVEDVHWADEATLDVLRYVARRIARTCSLLVLTYRDDELHRRHPLRTVLSDISFSAAAMRIELQALSEVGVRALVGERAIDASELHRRTAGNPFFVSEVLSYSGPGLPTSIRDAVLGRVARLSASAVSVLEAAAVVGSRIETWLLAAMLPEEHLAADECLSHGLLVEHMDGLAFRHELVRQAILDSTTPLRRRGLHRLALLALETSEAGRRDVIRLAHHAQGAGDERAILAYAPAAARHASAAGAHRVAAELLASSVLSAGGLALGERAGLLELHAWERHHIADLPAAISSWRDAVDLRRQTGAQLKEGQDLALLAVALSSAGQIEESRVTNHAAIELLATLPEGRELAVAYGTQAILHQYRHELADAISRAEQAIRISEQLGDTQILSMAYDTLGMSKMYLDYEAGCRYLEHARDVAQRSGLDADVARAYGDLGSISVRLFHLDEAERYLADGLAFTADRDLDRTRLYMLGWLSAAHLFRGRWTEAKAAAEDVLSTPASINARLVALVTLGRLRSRRGDGQPEVLDEALSLAGAAHDIRLIGPVRAARAEAACMAGDPAACFAETEAAYAMAVQQEHHWLAGELAYWRWRAGGGESPPDWIAEPFALQIRGDWRAAAEAWRQRGCPYEQARALADGTDASQERALAMLDRLGARPAAAQLRRGMRARGVRTVPRGPNATTRTNRYGLTTRQAEILDLLATGLTNSEIASRLSITPRTAEHHVAAVLAKLEVDSRRAAVHFARSHRPSATT